MMLFDALITLGRWSQAHQEVVLAAGGMVLISVGSVQLLRWRRFWRIGGRR